MANEIISYLEMCAREGASLQRGMNFSLGGNHSVVLMSVRPNALYRERLEDDGSTLIYEGHNEPRSAAVPDPKMVDQPEFTPVGTPTQNGLFVQAARLYELQKKEAGRVRVYEKIRKGIWSYNGMFALVGSWREKTAQRSVFKFKLVVLEEQAPEKNLTQRRRVIPTAVKLAVWKRDRGRCVECGAEDELHFDHVLP